jgi:TonB family protein
MGGHDRENLLWLPTFDSDEVFMFRQHRRNMKALVTNLAVIAAMITSLSAETRKPYSLPMPYAPLPEYPVDARAKHWTGSGRFLVSVDVDNGLVNGVRTLRTTGHSILDKAAEKALYRWKFPHGVLSMIIPVSFTTKGVEISYGDSGKKR